MTAQVRDETTISVVVPTFNRRDRLHRVLMGLSRQTIAGSFEVVVVSDGSTDGTDEYLRSGETPLDVTVVTQTNAGPAAARNAGLLASRGTVVLFVDDDVVPSPDLVEQHLLTHEASPDDIVAIGPMLTPGDAVLSPWVEWEQHQLYKQYNAMRDGLYDCTFRQFYTGNASVPRHCLIDVGMFDCNFRRAEDVELAFRLHQSGVAFRFVPEARGYHYADRTFASWLATASEYGRNDVTFMRSGNEWLTRSVPEDFEHRSLLVRTLANVCVPRPRLAAAVSYALAKLAVTPLPLGPTRRPTLSALYNLAYYRAIASELGSPRRFVRFISGAQPGVDGPLQAAFVLEQTLGHVTHSNNLERLVVGTDELAPSFLPVEFESARWTGKIPGLRNWTVRAGIRARRAIRRQFHGSGIDVMFIHTQVPAILAGSWMKRIPTVVSMDATPLQYDQMGDHYGHRMSSRSVERLKFEWNRRCFRRAIQLIAWSEWTRDGLVRDYGIDRDRLTVIAPGVDLARWGLVRRETRVTDRPVKILFVGGDLERKGGLLLLEATRVLREDLDVPAVELHLVTRADVPSDPDAVVHDDMAPNTDALIELYHGCDIFCLPTLADCLPLVLAEAAACSMALVCSDVGAIHELVRDEETGLLVPPANLDALVHALRRLVTDAALRHRLGVAAHALAAKDHDAKLNAGRIVELMIAVGTTPR